MIISRKREKYILSSSPLIRFMREKAENFVEPKRENPSRGRPAIFIRQKFAASLAMLQRLSLKEIAQSQGVPYTLLRKWATEPEFKRQVEVNSAEFISEYLKGLVKEMEILSPEKVPIDFFGRIRMEISILNPFLQKGILQKISALKHERPDLIFHLVNVVLVIILMMYQSKKGRRFTRSEIKDLTKFEKDVIESFKNFIGDELMGLLNKPRISDDDKKRGAQLIQTIKRLGAE